ncbi:hypothetical protein PG997_011975 [Apiospora hydei]|uniref:Nephrocystin 3-like N-terminal domain-containing protein n=1 Tax=Apiospora hydei TaxID=1337664 RepID=A0ABR1V226_9PEZI
MSPPRKRAREDSSDSDDEQLEVIHPEDVTIAIFCALAYESVAVKYTLDEELECPSKTPGRGSYIYSLGRIKEHNIVIARPVDMGPVNAAQCAATVRSDISFEKQVAQQFTNVRLALLVGIGAGIPSDKVDIRLGDVAISVPRDNHPGVVQHDFGKILISAIGALEEDEMMHKRPIKKILRRLAKEDMFARPTNGDILGLILSGGGVIKNPEDRERLRRGYQDAICFEMEAAGIMNEIPCLDGWHYYAAATAASYCKAVLLKVPGSEISETTPMKDIMNKVTESLHNIDTKVEELKQDIGLKNIRSWLSAPDPAANFNKAREQHQEGTGEWLIQDERYSTWKQEQNSFLWLSGIPGCGKTVLSSYVVADLTQNSAISRSLLYFYFDFNDEEKQSHDRALRSLITQLYEKRQDLREAVDTLHSTCYQGGQQPSVDSLRMLFQRLLWKASEIWIALDALDECPIRNGLLLWIDGLREAGMSIHILVTSRPEQDIKAAFENFCSENQIIYMQTDMVKDDINAYIRTRTRKMDRWKNLPEVQREIENALVSRADGMFRWAACQFEILNDCLDRPSIRRELSNLPGTLHETYTRILLSIDKKYQHHTRRLLQFLLYSKRPLQLEEAVDALAVDIAAPRGSRFDPSNRMPLPEEILRCCSGLVVLVKGRVREARMNIPWNTGTDMHTPWDTETGMHIRLAHFSVREYLMSNQFHSLHPAIAECLNDTIARTEIVKVCLSYLLSTTRESNQRLSVQDRGTNPHYAVPRDYHLAYYAARYWAEHAKAIELSQSTALQAVVEFLSLQETPSLSYMFYAPDHSIQSPDGTAQRVVSYPSADPRRISALYYASCTGLVHSATQLLQKGAALETKCGEFGTALHSAALYGETLFVEKLLKNGAPIDARSQMFGTALQAVAGFGEESMVKLLLENGAAIDDWSEICGTALEFASGEGRVSNVKLLLEMGAQIGYALHAAALSGHKDIIRLLLNKGAKLDMRDDYGFMPLRWAEIKCQSIEVMELLVP